MRLVPVSTVRVKQCRSDLCSVLMDPFSLPNALSSHPAATTYDICKLISMVGRANGAIRLVSLLQPPPETVALFDELILVDAGRVIYSGPLDQIIPYFESLGYFLPESMDVADWLQVSKLCLQSMRCC
jgi:hypothetical protein